MNYPIDNMNFIVLNVGHAVHDNDWNWNDVRSPFTRLYYVTDGEAKVKIHSTVYDLKPGHMYLIPSFVLHDDICQGHFEHYYLHIYEDIQSESKLFEDWNFPLEIEGSPKDIECFRRLMEIHPSMSLPQSNPNTYDNEPNLIRSIIKNKGQKFCDLVESRGLVYILISKFLKEAHAKVDVSDDRVRDILCFIRKNINQELRVEDLSKHFCISQDHFIRIFKKETGETPLRYIINRKIERAQLLLTTESTPVKIIAYNLGFDDASYFNRLFKHKVGVSPQRYREQFKK